MCTLSVISFARSVPPDLPGDLLVGGDRANASAAAERRSRARCSASRKIRPW